MWAGTIPSSGKPEPVSPLSVGNGEFAFTADVTGLQSFSEHYKVPLGTQSQWGWHSSGDPARYRPQDIRLTDYDTYGRQVGYAVDDTGQEEAFHWLRQNPHRIQLGQIGLRLLTADDKQVKLEELHDIEQTLDLWSGLLISRFRVDGVSITVHTCCHPHADQLSVRIESPLLTLGRLEVTIAFPSPHPVSRNWQESTGLSWSSGELHQTEFLQDSLSSGVFRRTMDHDRYSVKAAWSDGELSQTETHRYCLRPSGTTASLEFTLGFSATEKIGPLSGYEETEKWSKDHWERFWTEGGAVELAASKDPRAMELERRIVLSQFLTAIHCAGSLPPQETGLLHSTWFGKFHLEMHWWHAVHFALWGRTQLLRKSLDWYVKTLPAAIELARSQGYEGARWPKMVGPQGYDSPSSIGPLLIWQQPHPIVYAELCYLAEPDETTLAYFREVVMMTAEFMASFTVWEPERSRYVLGPPVIPAQEEHKAEAAWNPTFELEYWRHGLELAQAWRERLGLPPEAKWSHICEHLSDLPQADGVYLAHENAPDTYTRSNTDHPSMLGALGILPGKSVRLEIMKNTLYKVLKEWQWPTSWGWDFPMTAMTAARLGEGNIAVDALLMDTAKNSYLRNGHNYQQAYLTAYLPGNGGLLAAVAMMACGWQGGDDQAAPGFPKDGSWTVRWEGLNAWL
ncbi:glycoside hydrolase family 65 [Paenibacillus sp. TAB 01]|uniref:glycoside hydrolase family 65 n=1 Tax=Paenibacillus sp. TAB 01 TaxID=3368988 RepID=UPI0037527A1E